MTSTETSAAKSAFAAALLGNVALSFGAWFVRLADVGPVASAFWRLALAMPILIGAAAVTGWRPDRLDRRSWIGVALAGLFFAADLAAWHLGILRTTLANATLFGNSAVLIFPVYGFIAARALPSRSQAIALLLATVGGGMLLGKSYQLDMRNLAGDLMCLLAGALYTLYFVVLARPREAIGALPSVGLATAAATPPLLVAAIAMGETVWPHAWGPLLGLALLSQVIGQGLMIYALGKLPPVAIGIAMLVQPVIGALIGWGVYREHLGTVDLIGALLVAAALVLIRQPPPATVEARAALAK